MKNKAYSIEYVVGFDKLQQKHLYAFVLVPSEKLNIYRKKIELMGGDFEQEGAKLILSGEGEKAPDEIKKEFERIIKSIES